MSRYDGLIIPRSYSEYINKTDAATLQQALQLSGVLSAIVAAGDNKAVKSSAVYEALNNYINKTDAATIQQALQLPGVLSGAVAAGDNKAVTSNAVNGAFASYPEIISNDNGIAYKFPSGVLICTKQVSLVPIWSSWGVLYETNDINLGKWPYYFVDTEIPRIQASVVGPYGGFTSTVKNVSYINTGITSIVRPNTPPDTTMYVDIIGIGRYK